ncbi:hypothetical protein CC80DRAFT_532385 [Byssothecium circinans]|uniref:Cell wall protein n=1 Tax=Byssothecium circinans TaxID=147558 RepID=A0A6A5U7B8_9PLEO|nr:hypothetical protein CC80DRAFT_532385 [Byssothecium circinans]
MKFFLLLSAASTALALALPQQQGGENRNSTSSGSTCNSATAEKVAKLAGGIQSNIAIQVQELQGIKTLQALVASNTTTLRAASSSGSDFELERQAVLQIQQTGVDLRTANQKVAAELKSPSEKGLATVSMAQTLEIQQVKSLEGSGQKDQDVLMMLVKEVMDGTMQNKKNLAAAVQRTPQIRSVSALDPAPDRDKS